MRSSVSYQPKIFFSEVKPKQEFDNGNLGKKERTVAVVK